MDRNKFRVYNTKRECYEDSRNHAIDRDGILYEFKHGLKPVNMDIRIIEWCTGLKDKDGDLIYGGDRLRGHGMYPFFDVVGDDATGLENYQGEVYYWEEQACWYLSMNPVSDRVRGCACGGALFDFNLRTCEIIGTTHENPELLEERQSDF